VVVAPAAAAGAKTLVAVDATRREIAKGAMLIAEQDLD